MKQGIYTIQTNTKIADGIWKMVLEGDGTAVTAPGQFVDLKLDGRFLRRPISVHDADETSITIIYKVLGHGTEDMTRYEPGKQLDVIADVEALKEANRNRPQRQHARSWLAAALAFPRCTCWRRN